MKIKKNQKKIHPLNIVGRCNRYSLPLWQCPSFLVLPTGVANIIAMLATYYIAVKYTRPEIVALIVIFTSLVLLVISCLIIQGFEKLAESNRMKSRFVSIASHQLRTPLTSIKWAVNLLTGQNAENLTKSQKEQLQGIAQSNQRMINLINDLLNVSRIEEGRMVLTPKPVDIALFIEKIKKEYQAVAENKNIKIQLSLQESLPKAKIDEAGLAIVFRNLLDNAIKYSSRDDKIEIKAFLKNNFIRCEVKDSGIGIPQKDQKKIFQKFFRSGNVLKKETKGTGLGLFVAKSIIDNTGSKIGFQSKKDEGSLFWLELPIKH